MNRNDLSKFLFPIKLDDDGNIQVKYRFGIFSVIIWKLYCMITGE